MKDAQKPDRVSLSALLTNLRDGRYVIPDFQRDFEWRPWDIRDLMRSIFMDYYIGSLLLWRVKNENLKALSCEPIYGHSGLDKAEYVVLDGQQRLTAINYAFTAPKIRLPNRRSPFVYFIHVDRYMNMEFDEAFGYDRRTASWERLLKDEERQYERHLFPLSILGSGKSIDFVKWIQGYERYWKQQDDSLRPTDPQQADQAANNAANAWQFHEEVEAITNGYQVSYIELDRDIAVDKVCEIFTQLNSRGIRLDVFDLMNALLKPQNLQLKKLWHDARSRLEDVDTEKMNVYILQVMSILRQSYCSPKYLYFLLPGQEKPIRDPDGTRRKEVLIPDTTAFTKRWSEAVDAIAEAIKILQHPQEYGAIKSDYLPYVSILPVFSALRAHIKSLSPARQLDARRKLEQNPITLHRNLRR